MATRTKQREEFLGDIITTAIEGGIGYWSQCSQYQYQGTGLLGTGLNPCVGQVREGEGTRATIHELDEYGDGYKDESLEITIETIAKGINQIIKCEKHVNSGLYTAIARGNKENDAGEIDADAADVIVQVALFGEIIYG